MTRIFYILCLYSYLYIYMRGGLDLRRESCGAGGGMSEGYGGQPA